MYCFRHFSYWGKRTTRSAYSICTTIRSHPSRRGFASNSLPVNVQCYSVFVRKSYNSVSRGYPPRKLLWPSSNPAGLVRNLEMRIRFIYPKESLACRFRTIAVSDKYSSHGIIIHYSLTIRVYVNTWWI